MILPSSRFFGPLAVVLLLCIIALLIPLDITAVDVFVDVIVVDVNVVSTVFVVTGMIRDVVALTFAASGVNIDDSKTKHKRISNNL